MAGLSLQTHLVAPTQSSVPALASSEVAHKPGMLLIVDDLPLNRVVLSMMVKKAGLGVAFACNGLECVKAIQSQPPGSYCMVLMDLHMPCMDGYTATQMLRRWETSTHPPHPHPDAPASQRLQQQWQQLGNNKPDQQHQSQPLPSEPSASSANAPPRPFPRLPIVACTAELHAAPPRNESHMPGGALVGSTALSHALRCGVDECVAKPLPFGLLCAILRRYIPSWCLPLALARPQLPGNHPSAGQLQAQGLLQPMQLSAPSLQADAVQAAEWGAELATCARGMELAA